MNLHLLSNYGQEICAYKSRVKQSIFSLSHFSGLGKYLNHNKYKKNQSGEPALVTKMWFVQILDCSNNPQMLWCVRILYKVLSFRIWILFCTRSIVTQWCNRDACFHRVYRSSRDGSATQTRTQTIYSSCTLLVTNSSELNRLLIDCHIIFKAYVHDFCDRHDCQSMIKFNCCSQHCTVCCACKC